MKIIALLFVLCLFLYAEQSKIVLITYSNKQTAIESLKKFLVSHRTLFHERNNTTSSLEAGVFQSQQYYFLALKPFATRHAAEKILQQLQSNYPSAYISSYPNAVNHLVLSQPVRGNATKSTTQPTQSTAQKKRESPIVLEQEFLEPLSIEEIIHTTTPHHTAVKNVETKAIATQPKSIQPILYFSYLLLSILILAVVVLVVKNHRLKGQIHYKQALLNTHNVVEHDDTAKHIPIQTIDLAHYVKTALTQAINEHAALLALKPIQQIQTCMNDLVTIDSFMHGEVYIKNREFPLRYITEDIAKRYRLTFECSSNVPHRLIGSVETLEHIFLRLSYTNITTISIDSVSHSDESIQLQFTLVYEGIENHAVDYGIIKQFVLSVGGTLTPKLDDYDIRPISMFTLPFLHVEENTSKIKRP